MVSSDFELLCLFHKVSYVKLANQLNLSPKTVNMWVKGRCSVPEKWKNSIAHYLKTSSIDLTDKDRLVMLETLLSEYLGKRLKIALH